MVNYTYFINDISFESFGHSNFSPEIGSGDCHEIALRIDKMPNGEFTLFSKHKYTIIQNNKDVIWINTSAVFAIREHEQKSLSMDACLRVVALLLEYTRAFLANESKSKLNVFILMNQPPQENFRQAIEQELIKMN